MARMKSAFCFTNLRTGTLIIGWQSLAFDIIYLIFGDAAVKKMVDAAVEEAKLDNLMRGRHQEELFEKNAKEVTKTTLKATVYLTMAVCIAIHISLLYGATKGRRTFLLPFVIAYGLVVVVGSLSLFGNLVGETAKRGEMLAVKLFSFASNIYFLCVVGSFYAELHPANQCVESSPVIVQLERPSNEVPYVVQPTNSNYEPMLNQEAYPYPRQPYVTVQNPATSLDQPPPYMYAVPVQNHATFPVPVASAKEFTKTMP